VAATPQAGKIVRVDNRPTECGKFATRQDVITPVAQAWSSTFRTLNGRWGTMTVRGWSNQEPGYGEAQLGAAGGSKSLSTRNNEFGLEDGSSSQFVADAEVELDQIPVGLVTTACEEVRVKDVEGASAGDAPVTWKQTVTFNRYEGYAQTVAEALELVEDMANLGDYNTSSFTSATGDRMYKVTGRSRPLTFGVWSQG